MEIETGDIVQYKGLIYKVFHYNNYYDDKATISNDFLNFLVVEAKDCEIVYKNEDVEVVQTIYADGVWLDYTHGYLNNNLMYATSDREYFIDGYRMDNDSWKFNLEFDEEDWDE